jgi:hypothetical protein
MLLSSTLLTGGLGRKRKIYAWTGKMDWTSAKIFSVLDESFEKK